MGNPDFRYLFHKPNTNLYYLHTNDDKYTTRQSSLNTSLIVPQMTFGCKPEDLINIMKTILNMSNVNYNLGKSDVKTIKNTYEDLQRTDNMTNEFINSYTEKTEIKLDDTFKAYFFMILYKLDIYINLYHDSDRSEYFKSYISFLSRHSNHTFYELMIKWFETNNKLNRKQAVKQIQILLSSVNGLSMLYGLNKKQLKSKIEHINKTDEKYGDPYESIVSYFDFFEDPLTDDSVGKNDQDWFDKDWLIYSNIEAFTTKMDIKNGILLTENRLFNIEIKSYIKNESNVKVNTRELKIIDLKKFIIDMTAKNKVNNSYKLITKISKTKKTKKPSKKPSKKASKKTSKKASLTKSLKKSSSNKSVKNMTN
jgi:hypothetical protein